MLIYIVLCIILRMSLLLYPISHLSPLCAWVCKWMTILLYIIIRLTPLMIECAIIHHFDGATGIPFTPQWALDGRPERNVWRRRRRGDAWQVMLVGVQQSTDLAHSEHSPQATERFVVIHCSNEHSEVMGSRKSWSLAMTVEFVVELCGTLQTRSCPGHYCKTLHGVAFVRLQPKTVTLLYTTMMRHTIRLHSVCVYLISIVARQWGKKNLEPYKESITMSYI